MDPQYKPEQIENSAQKFWEENASFKAIEALVTMDGPGPPGFTVVRPA